MNPEHGLGTYLSKVKVLELAEPKDNTDFQQKTLGSLGYHLKPLCGILLIQYIMQGFFYASYRSEANTSTETKSDDHG